MAEVVHRHRYYVVLLYDRLALACGEVLEHCQKTTVTVSADALR